jgi:hypothetical protein
MPSCRMSCLSQTCMATCSQSHMLPGVELTSNLLVRLATSWISREISPVKAAFRATYTLWTSTLQCQSQPKSPVSRSSLSTKTSYPHMHLLPAVPLQLLMLIPGIATSVTFTLTQSCEWSTKGWLKGWKSVVPAHIPCLASPASKASKFMLKSKSTLKHMLKSSLAMCSQMCVESCLDAHIKGLSIL